MVVELTNGCTIAFPPRLAQGLENANEDQLAELAILRTGYGLHWETLDVDLDRKDAGRIVGTVPKVCRQLAEEKESRIEEGRLMSDHVHMMISIPPKYAVSQMIGFINGRSAIHLAWVYGEN